jgi:hypothetical protein
MDQEQEEDGEEGDVSMRTDEGRDEEVVVVGEDVRGQEKDDGKEDEDEDEPRDEHEEDDEDDEDEDDDEEGEEEVMVPMADMLNAAYERDNVSFVSLGPYGPGLPGHRKGFGVIQDEERTGGLTSLCRGLMDADTFRPDCSMKKIV